MSRILAVIICILFLELPAQDQRGFEIVTSDSAQIKRTFALIVGVSDYPDVTPLSFATEDAILIYEFLRSKSGGEVPDENIRILLDEEATQSNIWSRGISWLQYSVKPGRGDRVFLYFSGHGDAIDAQEAFYLCYDANPAGDKNLYNASGALDIGKLKRRIAAMETNGAEVVLIMDACRSGDLPGARSGLTNPFESVMEERAGETLLLSASANQLALEDRRWGGGHGVFTWYLVKGLSGEADGDSDGQVTLYELQRFVTENVMTETRKLKSAQTPYFCCTNEYEKPISRFDRDLADMLDKHSSSAVVTNQLANAARQNIENAMFQSKEIREDYNQLKMLCREGKFLGSNSADSLYKLMESRYLAIEMMPVRQYFAGALASECQRAINLDLISKEAFDDREIDHARLRRIADRALVVGGDDVSIIGLREMRDLFHAVEYSQSVQSFQYDRSHGEYFSYIADGVHYKDTVVWPSYFADSILKSLKSRMDNSAYYHYCLAQYSGVLKIPFHWENDISKNNEYLRANELAPSWPLPVARMLQSNAFGADDSYNRIVRLYQSDTTSVASNYLMYHFYINFIPYHPGLAKRHLKFCLDNSSDLRYLKSWMALNYPKQKSYSNSSLRDYSNVPDYGIVPELALDSIIASKPNLDYFDEGFLDYKLKKDNYLKIAKKVLFDLSVNKSYYNAALIYVIEKYYLKEHNDEDLGEVYLNDILVPAEIAFFKEDMRMDAASDQEIGQALRQFEIVQILRQYQCLAPLVDEARKLDYFHKYSSEISGLRKVGSAHKEIRKKALEMYLDDEYNYPQDSLEDLFANAGTFIENGFFGELERTLKRMVGLELDSSQMVRFKLYSLICDISKGKLKNVLECDSICTDYFKNRSEFIAIPDSSISCIVDTKTFREKMRLENNINAQAKLLEDLCRFERYSEACSYSDSIVSVKTFLVNYSFNYYRLKAMVMMERYKDAARYLDDILTFSDNKATEKDMYRRRNGLFDILLYPPVQYSVFAGTPEFKQLREKWIVD